MVPCVIFEDDHLLAVNKPAGWNTHAPAPYAGEGIYDWLRNREPRWASLAILHRLDKETSGILVFGKTPLANRSLTEQFTQRQVHKKYLLFTDRQAPAREFTAKSTLLRIGEKYASRPGGELAETKFTPIADAKFAVNSAGLKMVSAEPLTGRTHQIRVHAAEHGFPILGDTLYGGTASSRVFLHAREITFAHPATKAPLQLLAPLSFDTEPRLSLRTAVIEPGTTNACRLIHGASDGWPGWFVEKLGDWLLSQADAPLMPKQNEELARLMEKYSSHGAYHKILSRRVQRSTTAESSPQLALGNAAPGVFEILENGVRYELSFGEGYSVGLFLDQRDNRRRLLTGHVAADFRLPWGDGQTAQIPSPQLSSSSLGGARGTDRPGPGEPGSRIKNLNWEIRKPQFEMLNVFAYTCGFSVCAAKAGARTTSLDLSKKYLEWGRRNFALNGLRPEAHDFIFGDAFDWLRRLGKKGRMFNLIVLDPPTFSQSKEHGAFRVEKNFGDLVTAALPVLHPGGVLLASTNAADWSPEKFQASVESAVRLGRRKIARQQYVPQPPDFPISRDEPAYLKTVWLQITGAEPVYGNKLTKKDRK